MMEVLKVETNNLKEIQKNRKQRQEMNNPFKKSKKSEKEIKNR